MDTETLAAVGIAAIGGIALLLRRSGEAASIEGLRNALEAERSALEEQIEGQDGQSEYIRQLNQALSQLRAGAGTDISEAFTADLSDPGGSISSVGEGETGGGNPDYGDVIEEEEDDDDSGSSVDFDFGGSFSGDYGGGSTYSPGDGGVLDDGDVSSIGVNP